MNRLLELKASNVEGLLSLLFIVFTYFAPIQPILIITAIALFADFVSGLWVSRRIGEGWTSRKAWRTVSKSLCAFAVILLFYGYEQVFKIQLFSPAKVIAAVICAFETWSILENFAKITDHPMFTFLKQFMKNKVEQEIGQKIDLD